MSHGRPPILLLPQDAAACDVTAEGCLDRPGCAGVAPAWDLHEPGAVIGAEQVTQFHSDALAEQFSLPSVPMLALDEVMAQTVADPSWGLHASTLPSQTPALEDMDPLQLQRAYEAIQKMQTTGAWLEVGPVPEEEAEASNRSDDRGRADDEQASRKLSRKQRRRTERLREKLLKMNLRGLPFLGSMEGFFEQLRRAYSHPNRRLHYDDVLMVLLLAFFNPLARSLRCIEDISKMAGVRAHTGLDCIHRSTLSDALARFDPQLLKPLMLELRKGLDDRRLDAHDPDLRKLLKHAIYFDGSYFRLAVDVQWALQQRVGGAHSGRKFASVRLNLKLAARDNLPQGMSISGSGDDSEAEAICRELMAGELMVGDRGCFSHKTIARILLARADFLFRLQRTVKYEVQQQRPLSQKDIEHGVREDQIVCLTGCKSLDKTALYRRIVIDPEPAAGPDNPDRACDRQPIVLLSSIDDQTPAWALGELYRRRWDIELYFRWLKVNADCKHLLSHHANGVEIQFYVAMIATLLLALFTGRQPNKYDLNMTCCIVMGLTTTEEAEAIMAERRAEREKAKAAEAARRAAKKVA